MGLAASQGRFLCLTARNNDLVYEGQQISQQRMALADKTKEIADRYNDKMNNKKMQAVVIENGSEIAKDLSYDLLVNQSEFSGLGMRIVDLNGNVVIPGDYLEVTKTEANKPTETSRYYSTDDFIKANFPDITEEEKINLSTKPLSELKVYYDNKYGFNNENSPVKLNPIVGPGDHTHIDPDCIKTENGQSKYLQQKLISGEWTLEKANVAGTWDAEVWQGSNKIAEVFDTSDDAQAEAEYESDMLALQKRDKLLELRLEEVETEQSAVEKEMESIKKVIDKNIEDSFKTFA